MTSPQELRPKIIGIQWGVFFLSASLLVFLTLRAQKKRQAQTDSKTRPKNLVLIVMDGLSPQFLSPYNPEENTPEFQEIADQSLVFDRMYTNHTHTYGYFCSLYCGQKTPRKKSPNLLSLLQKQDVNTRWSVCHNNACPDLYGYPYQGFRSGFLFKGFTWIPELFGMDYNVLRGTASPEGRGRAMGARQQALYDLMVYFFKSEFTNPLTTELPEQIERLHKDSRPFFLLYHTKYNAETAETSDERGLWEKSRIQTSPLSNEKEALRKKIQDQIESEQDYGYSEEQAWVTDIFRASYRKGVCSGTKSLKAFFDLYRSKGWDQDTVLIVTADHGQIYSQGRLFYGFHGQEPVTRVPFLIYDGEHRGRDSRLGETLDVTQTILDHFHVPEALDPEAHSLLLPAREKSVSSLTLDSNHRKEKFLALYRDNVKFLWNVWDVKKTNPLPKKYLVQNFEEIPLPSASSEVSSFDRDKLLREYGEIP